MASLQLAKRLHGQCGLLFTERSKEDVVEWSHNYTALEYARSGFVATETVTLPEGRTLQTTDFVFGLSNLYFSMN